MAVRCMSFFQIDPSIGGGVTWKFKDSGVVSLSTSGATTDLGLAIPVDSIIWFVAAKTVDVIAGVSAANASVNLDWTGGSSLACVNFVNVGDGNIAANTKRKKLYDASSASNLVAGSAADLRLTISGGADNIPSAGSVRAVVHYFELTDLN